MRWTRVTRVHAARLARECAWWGYTGLRYFHSASSRYRWLPAMDRRSVHRWPQSMLVSASAKRPRKHADNPLKVDARRCGQLQVDLAPFGSSVSLGSRCSYVRKLMRVIVHARFAKRLSYFSIAAFYMREKDMPSAYVRENRARSNWQTKRDVRAYEKLLIEKRNASKKCCRCRKTCNRIY